LGSAQTGVQPGVVEIARSVSAGSVMINAPLLAPFRSEVRVRCSSLVEWPVYPALEAYYASLIALTPIGRVVDMMTGKLTR
jgi:hypothetical protein